MPALNNYTWEEYARQRAQGKNRIESGLIAGLKDGKGLRSSCGRIELKPEVQARIAELQQRVEDGIVEKKTAGITQVLEEFGHLAFLDVGDAFDENGNLLPIKQMPEGVRRAISGIEYEDVFSGRGEERECTGRIAKVKFVDKKGALDSIAKHLGMFIERQQMLDRNGKPMDMPQVTVQFVKVDASTATSSVSGEAVISLPAGAV